jgi:transposase-like protein
MVSSQLMNLLDVMAIILATSSGGSTTANRGGKGIHEKGPIVYPECIRQYTNKDYTMDPSTQFCPNFYCSKRGLAGQGNIRVHSRKEQRFRCTCCRKTFAASKNTPFYRLHKPIELVTIVLTLLTHGCPLQAIVAAFGFDERTVADWQERAGRHAQRFHELHVEQGQVDAQHIQADELWVKMVARKVWMAMAMAVPSRLWLGGLISRHRDTKLITALVQKVRNCLASLAVLVCVDGLASYVGAFVKGFRHKVYSGRRGGPRLVVEPGLLIGQVIKRFRGRRLVEVVRRVVRGSAAAIARVLERTGTGQDINTSYIERLNATFRANWTGLVRRGRALLHQEKRVQAGMYLLGCAYNWCWAHDSLRVRAKAGIGRRWQERTPAMAAGLTEQCWELEELLRWRVVPAQWKPPRKKRRRRRKGTPAPMAFAA